jgi:F420-dependent oxidoreductase-like protein
MRIGTMLSEPFAGPDQISGLRDVLMEARQDGLASAWMPNIFGLDALTALAAAGSQVDGIELGTGVVPTYPRHPAVLAQQALTTQLAVGGRLTLGIGLSHQVVIEGMYGYSFDRPAVHMREYLSVLLPLLQEGAASFSGSTLSAQVTLNTPRPYRVPVLLAALAPRMLKLAGEKADGTVLWMTGPETVRTHVVPTIRDAAQKAGRPDPRVVCALPVCVTGDADAARERAAQVFQVYGYLPSYRAMLDREGAAGPADVGIIGDEDGVRSQIEALADAGVTEFVGGEFGVGDDAARTRAVLKELAAAPVG